MSLITITDVGVNAPTTDDVVSALWQVFLDAFGSELTQDTSTPQGQLVVSQSAIYQDALNKFVQMLNMFDPQYSEGIYQDAIGRIYFLNRHQATASTATIIFNGLSGVVIPSGFQLQDANGNTWQTISQLTIDTSGTITGIVQCTVTGVVTASANTITIIVKALSGLDRVTNPSSAVAGSDEQSPNDFEIMRQESVSANAKMTDGAVRGSIANLPDVTDVWVKSNYSANTVTMGVTNYIVAPYSILCSVQGGTDAEVALQLLTKAGTGCPFAGNTTVTVYDTDTYPQSPPSYTVTFLRPTTKELYFKVTVEDLASLSATTIASMKSAIIKSLTSGSTRARIGGTVTALRYYSAIIAVQSIAILSITVSKDGTTYDNSISYGVDEFPATSEFNIQFVQG